MYNSLLLHLSHTPIPIKLNWRWLLPQSIALKVSKEANVEKWVYYIQGSAVGEI